MVRKTVLNVVAAVGAAACVFLVLVMIRQGLDRSGAWAAPLAALAGIVAAVAAVWGPVPRPPKVPVPPALQLPEWVVGRPAELAAVVQALMGARPGTVGITTGLYGAGGFGKTMLARMVSVDRRVQRRFAGRVYLVTVGRDVRGAAAVAAKVNEVIKFVFDEDVTFTDPQLAGARLGSLLDGGPRRLLVLDDVWEAEQLAPFAEGGKKCARLVTTRVPELLAGRGAAVRVDQMSPEQAQALLTAGLPRMDSAVTQGLLAVTGRWPLLLRLVNTILADYGRVAADVEAQAAVLLERLRVGGPAVIDDLRGSAVRGLDVGKPQERARAVQATIGASTSLLDPSDERRFAELGVFAEEVIPLRLAARLWQATTGLDDRDDLQASQICGRLARLALVSQVADPVPGITVHAVVREFLRAKLGQQQLADLNGRLLDAAAKDLPAASPLDPAQPAVAVAWWELSQQDRYLWDHLVEHLLDARRSGDADAVACDLRWIGARLERFGPTAPAADLSLVGTPRAARMRAALVRAAHLLAVTEPAGAVVDILHSRVADDPDWEPQVHALRNLYCRPRLVNCWPLPDLAGAALLRVLIGHIRSVEAVAVALDCSWLVSGGGDGTVRIWDPAAGRQRAVLEGHTGPVAAVAVAPDGSWLASGGDDKTVRIWDPAAGRQRALLEGHTRPVTAVAVAPDGSWLASASDDKTVRIWDPAAGRQLAVLEGHTRPLEAVAVAPDGSWLASASWDKTVRIWDPAAGRQLAVLEGHTDTVTAVASAADGSWLASASWDKTVRIWDPAAGRQLAVLEGHTDQVAAVASAADGSWLASASWDKTVRIWDPGAGRQLAVLEGHTDTVTAAAVAAAPDGSWLVSGGGDGTVRIWDPAAGRQRALLEGHTRPLEAVAVAPDGSWLVSGGGDGTVRIWDPAAGRQRALLEGRTGPVRAVAVAPVGGWLVSGGGDGTVRIWDAVTSQERAVLEGHTDTVTAVAVAADGSWLASASWDKTVRIWDAVTSQERAVLEGHTDTVTAVAVAPVGGWLASGSGDGTVRIWDVAAGRQRALLEGHTEPVTAVAVAPDGSWLASASDDRTVRIWDVATGQARALMRTENRLRALAWLGVNALAVGGSAGLYLFDFLVSTSPATPGSNKDDG